MDKPIKAALPSIIYTIPHRVYSLLFFCFMIYLCIFQKISHGFIVFYIKFITKPLISSLEFESLFFFVIPYFLKYLNENESTNLSRF